MAPYNGETTLLRSEAMIYIPTEVAHATVDELGQMEVIQFKDLNEDVNAFSRTYVGEIRRLDDMERRLNFLTSKIKDDDDIGILPFEQTGHLLDGRPGPQLIDELAPKLVEHEERVGQMQNSYEALHRRLIELEEARQVLRETASFFSDTSHLGRAEELRASFDEAAAPLLDNAMEQGHGGEASGIGGLEIEFVTGTIDRARMPTFERVLWRVLRGNLFMNYAEIEEPFRDPSKPASSDKSQGVRKNVFLIFAHGHELLEKIRKIAESMGGTLYPIDSNADKRDEALREVVARIEDLSAVLQTTDQTRRAELARIAESISAWWAIVRKEKAIYETMNRFQYDSGRRTLVAEGWIPTRDLGAVQLALRRAADRAGTSVPPILHELRNAPDPPTFHRTNKFTQAFQAIIDAYGIATYQEVNPGLFTIITFPFLFAVMFGDIGHGFIMALAAFSLIMVEKRFPRGMSNEILDTFFFGRYIIFLMGIFAIYTGFLYNDIFSLSLNTFKSGWSFPDAGQAATSTGVSTNTTYLMGLDPAWHGADNALIFTNSMKMKMSIVLGVIHMSFAICLQLPNLIHFGHRKFIMVEWLPQFLFLESIFGYLVICIVYKWMVDWSQTDSQPPNLLNMLIYMFLSPGSVEPSEQLFPLQGPLQVALLLLALACVPVMLFGAPYLKYKDHQRIKSQGYEHLDGADGGDSENGDAQMQQSGHGSDDFDFGDIMINQIIHTIEFCLGAISNTASYLRLWALSLAHAQLSEVLWSMVFKRAFTFKGPLGMVLMVAFSAAWLMLTVAILVLMEGLSAFLHALRLHWVEANSKHYMGQGTAFAPLEFDGLLYQAI